MNPILRDTGLSQIVATEAPEPLAEGFEFTEGPLWCPDGSVLFQDIRAERSYRLRPDRSVQIVREQTGAANGQTYASDGRIVFCEQNGRRISAMNPDGTNVQTIAETWSGKRLNSPNDIVARSDGGLYFTDPPYGVAPKDRQLHFQGVYLLDERGETRLLADDFEKPNGLAFSPDERTLYVCDTARYHVRAFDVEPSGTLRIGSSRVFATMDPDQPGGPDGMKVDRDGRVYVAVAQGVWVYEAGGTLLGIIALPKRPANLAWSEPDAKALTLTVVDRLYRVRLNVAGILPPFTPLAPSA
ncbi:SMP-30/gluconolactonase/LRE family protein [Singulisphaera acidiphila]|uniref:Gluconolactonase n=1 Tax=Singulisphaera acidiphila (strain ATCC BAA-1392 / DSM 18658 / VKM B-2454 / MOB10) TaxID=886293 RepID=L0DIC5_SINAD|nr:SMP-30/gluconolactonase/LRE family protein [Singulisphaera acidiphila]AGA29012.1 gluconolactonase [Singulisphaera acidiphila DSM 18658]